MSCGWVWRLLSRLEHARSFILASHPGSLRGLCLASHPATPDGTETQSPCMLETAQQGAICSRGAFRLRKRL